MSTLPATESPQGIAPPVSRLTRRGFLKSSAALSLLFWLPSRADAASRIHLLEGEVYVNNRLATQATQIQPGDRIVVAFGGKLAVSIGGDAYLLREGSVLEIEHGPRAGGQPLIAGLRLVTGALLAVFEKRRQPTHIITSTATIGIRGTAVYLDAQPHRLYTCTCYGTTELRLGQQVKSVSATHHSAHEVAPDGSGVMAMQSMEVRGHTDDELRMLEGYVGRKPPFDN